MLAITDVVHLITIYKYWILFPIAVVEGPIVSLIAGFLVSIKVLGFVPAYIVLVLGDLGGDCFYYGIGRWGGLPAIRRWGKYVGLHPHHIGQVERQFIERPWKVLFFGKTQAWGSLILAAAGITKMPFGRFMLINGLATLIKSAALLVIGYYFGQAYEVASRYIQNAGLIMGAIAVAALAAWFIYQHYGKNRNNN